MRPIKRDQHVEYVPQCDRDLPESEQTVLLVKPLSQFEYRRVLAIVGENFDLGSLSSKGADCVFDVARRCIVGWRNFPDESGVELECKREKEQSAFGIRVEMCTEDSLEPFDFTELANVFGFVMNNCQLTEDDRKN